MVLMILWYVSGGAVNQSRCLERGKRGICRSTACPVTCVFGLDSQLYRASTRACCGATVLPCLGCIDIVILAGTSFSVEPQQVVCRARAETCCRILRTLHATKVLMPSVLIRISYAPHPLQVTSEEARYSDPEDPGLIRRLLANGVQEAENNYGNLKAQGLFLAIW